MLNHSCFDTIVNLFGNKIPTDIVYTIKDFIEDSSGNLYKKEIIDVINYLNDFSSLNIVDYINYFVECDITNSQYKIICKYQEPGYDTPGVYKTITINISKSILLMIKKEQFILDKNMIEKSYLLPFAYKMSKNYNDIIAVSICIILIVIVYVFFEYIFSFKY